MLIKASKNFYEMADVQFVNEMDMATSSRCQKRSNHAISEPVMPDATTNDISFNKSGNSRFDSTLGFDTFNSIYNGKGGKQGRHDDRGKHGHQGGNDDHKRGKDKRSGKSSRGKAAKSKMIVAEGVIVTEMVVEMQTVVEAAIEVEVAEIVLSIAEQMQTKGIAVAAGPIVTKTRKAAKKIVVAAGISMVFKDGIMFHITPESFTDFDVVNKDHFKQLFKSQRSIDFNLKSTLQRKTLLWLEYSRRPIAFESRIYCFFLYVGNSYLIRT